MRSVVPQHPSRMDLCQTCGGTFKTPQLMRIHIQVSIGAFFWTIFFVINYLIFRSIMKAPRLSATPKTPATPETVHSTFKKFELGRGMKVSRKLATDHHLLKAHQSISTFNALKMGGTPTSQMRIRPRTTSTSSSSPRSSPSSKSSSWDFRKKLFNHHSLSPLSK